MDPGLGGFKTCGLTRRARGREMALWAFAKAPISANFTGFFIDFRRGFWRARLPGQKMGANWRGITRLLIHAQSAGLHATPDSYVLALGTGSRGVAAQPVRSRRERAKLDDPAMHHRSSFRDGRRSPRRNHTVVQPQQRLTADRRPAVQGR
jgi:hypothetical protein